MCVELLFKRSNKKMKIKYSPSAVECEVDIFNIDFVMTPDSDLMRKSKIYILLSEELHLHNLPGQGSLGEWREQLKRQLLVKKRLELVSLAIKHSEIDKKAAMMRIKNR